MSYAYTPYLNGVIASFPPLKAKIDGYLAAGISMQDTEDLIRAEIEASLGKGVDIGLTGVIREYKAEAEVESPRNVETVMGIPLPVEEVKVYGDTPKELAEAYNTSIILAGAATVAGGALLAATSLASSIPFLGTGEALDEVWRIPIIRSSMDIATEVLFSHYNVVQRQLIQRHLFSVHKPLIPEPYRLVEMKSVGEISDGDYNQAMHENGLSDKWANAYINAGYSALSLDMILTMMRRGIIDEAGVHYNFRLNRFHPNYFNSLRALKDVIPPLSDLISMAVKEAFGDHSSKVQYPTYESWALKMGLSKEFAEAYWYAHWDRIALAQMYDNLYRGFWNKDQFMDMLRIKDVHPDDRDAIFNVAYQVPSIRELGYGFDVGLYSRDDIIKWRKYAGLSPADAEKAADSLILYRNEAEKNAVITEYMYLYAMGKWSGETFIDALKKFGLPMPTIQLWIDRGNAHSVRMSKPSALEEGRIISSSESLWALRHGLQGDDETRVQLKALDWTDERIVLALRKTHKEIEEAITDVKPIVPEPPSSSEVIWMYKYGVRNKEDFDSRLKALNWSDERRAIAALRADQEIAQEYAPKTLTESQWKGMFDAGVIDKEGLQKAYISFGYADSDASLLAMWAAVSIRFGDLVSLYKNGWIDAQAIYDELVSLGLPEARADELMKTVIKYNSGERTATEKDLTKAEIIKGWKSGVLDDMQAISLLVDLGYSEDEAYYLLQINMVVAKADPESYWEMKKVTEAYKKALGQKYKEVPNDLLIWEQRYKQIKKEVEELKAKKPTDDELSAMVILMAEVEANYRRIMMEWERPG